MQTRTRLLQELQGLSSTAKRKKKGDEPAAKRRSFGSQVEEDRKKGPKVKKKTKEEDLKKCSLKSWQRNEVVEGSQVDCKPLLVMKYIEGHTCSVRRKLRMSDFLGAWNLF